MSLYADRVQETTTTTGTGTITLAGAVLGFRAFQDALAVGDRCRYCITDGTDWEVGDGVLDTTTTLTRENVFSSSNSNALVSFAAGTKVVFVDIPAADIADIGLSIALAAFRHSP